MDHPLDCWVLQRNQFFELSFLEEFSVGFLTFRLGIIHQLKGRESDLVVLVGEEASAG